MNVETITMPKREAIEAYRQYRQSVKAPTHEDQAVMLGYRALAKGRAIINVRSAILAAGLDDKFRTRLALARADWKMVWYRKERWDFKFTAEEYKWGTETELKFTGLPWSWTRDGKTVGEYVTAWAHTPTIPPAIRPATGNLHAYHILLEAEWQDAPKDPLLLKHLAGDLYAVLAVWNLTPLEREVIRALRS